MEERDAVDKLKTELYSRVKSQRVSVGEDVRSPLSPEEGGVPRAWTPEEVEEEQPEVPTAPPIARLMEPEEGLSWPAKFLVGSVAFFIIAAGVSAYLFFGGRNTISPDNIDISILAPSLIDGGKPASLQVMIANRNKAPLLLSDLLIDYPDGTRSAVDPTQSLSHERASIGTIDSGAQLKRALTAQFYGQQGAQQQVHVTLEYTIDGSNSVFQKSTDVTFLIGSSPVAISVDAPSEAISGQQFSMDLTVAASGVNAINDVVVQGQFPAGFSLASSSPAAVAGGTFWRLGKLAPGTSRIIHLTGTLLGEDGDQRVFRFLSGSDSNPTNVTVAVPFLSIPTTIAIKQPFITATVALNGETGKTVAVAPGATVSGTITWQNNLPTPVQNATLKLTLTGNMLDTHSVQPVGGFYQSSDNSIIWNPQTNSELASIPAGGRGSVTFNFAPLATQPGSYINPTINLALAISGTRASDTGVPTDVNAAASARVAVSSQADLTVGALHFSGPIRNDGPMPPRVGQNTSYTIVWTIKNPSNSIANGKVTTALPPYVEFGKAGDDSVTYDPTSRTVTWNAGDIRPGVGYSSPAQSAAFQVILTPSVTQGSQTPSLISSSVFTGMDRFTQTPVSISEMAPTTRLEGDTGFQDSMSVVAE